MLRNIGQSKILKRNDFYKQDFVVLSYSCYSKTFCCIIGCCCCFTKIIFKIFVLNIKEDTKKSKDLIFTILLLSKYIKFLYLKSLL